MCKVKQHLLRAVSIAVVGTFPLAWHELAFCSCERLLTAWHALWRLYGGSLASQVGTCKYGAGKENPMPDGNAWFGYNADAVSGPPSLESERAIAVAHKGCFASNSIYQGQSYGACGWAGLSTGTSFFVRSQADVDRLQGEAWMSGEVKLESVLSAADCQVSEPQPRPNNTASTMPTPIWARCCSKIPALCSPNGQTTPLFGSALKFYSNPDSHLCVLL
jgi:hypothetical protein